MTQFTMTADLHLRAENARDGLEVLRWICRRTRENDAAGLLIGGDLFDDRSDGRALAGEVDDLLAEALDGRPAVMIAGNHDENLADLGWTGDVVVLGEGETYVLDGASGEPVVVHGLPYLRGRNVYRPPAVEDPSTGVHVLLAHASYLTPRHAHLLEWLSEAEENAFLLHEEDVGDRGYDHVLLGHWHGHQPLGGDPPATYVGSPVPARRGETGPRSILEGTAGGDGLSLESVPVASPPGWSYETRRETVVPGHEEAFLEELPAALPDPDPGCVVLLEVTGYTTGEPAAFRRRVEEAIEARTEDFRRIELEAGDLQRAEALDAPLLERLLEALENTPPGERLSVPDVIRDEEPSRVHELAEHFLEEEPGTLSQRARRLLLEGVCEVMEA